MRTNGIIMWATLAAALFTAACSTTGPNGGGETPWHLKALVAPAQPSVVTVINFDLDGDVASIGSGFFISKSGILLTSHHVLEGAYSAAVRTSDGDTFPVTAVLAAGRLVDLIKVRVDIPDEHITPIPTAAQGPEVADRVFVLGSPLGLEQTVSEGIISAIRDLPAGGRVLQLTAPISQGSSGGPVIDQHGTAVGVVAFQSTTGQNLNFAVSIDALDLLTDESTEYSIAEWTIRSAGRTPGLAAALCGKGTRLSIQGEYEEALTYFKRAAESNPDDPDAWYGLGSCYVGLDQPEAAIAAYRRPVDRDPDNATAQFVLAMAYKSIDRFDEEIAVLKEVLRIDPDNVRARFELGRAYGALARTDEQIRTFEAVLEAQPDHIPTLVHLGAALAEAGRLQEALRTLVRASAVEPDNALIHYNLGVAFNRLDRPVDAARAYTRAIRIHPRMVPAHFNLGVTYLVEGRRKEALDQYAILKALDVEAADRLFTRIYPESADDASGGGAAQ